MSRELLFSVTKKDFDIEFFRGSGNGGQNRNKRDTACRITHRDSGTVATAQEHRTQLANKKTAFLRLVKSDKFKLWYKKKLGRVQLSKAEIQMAVDKWMEPENLLVEVWDGSKWVEQ